jgi:hypothetical protein
MLRNKASCSGEYYNEAEKRCGESGKRKLFAEAGRLGHALMPNGNLAWQHARYNFRHFFHPLWLPEHAAFFEKP